MVHHVEGGTKVNVEKVDVTAFELGIFDGVDDRTELSRGALLRAEAFL